MASGLLAQLALGGGGLSSILSAGGGAPPIGISPTPALAPTTPSSAGLPQPAFDRSFEGVVGQAQGLVGGGGAPAAPVAPQSGGGGSGPETSQLLTGGLGAAQLIGGFLQRRKAKSLAPPLRDPDILARMDEIGARRRAFETGTAFAPQTQQIREREQNTLSQLGRRARSTGEFLAGAGVAGGQAGRQLGDVFAQGQQVQNQLLQQENQFAQGQSQRALELQNLARAQSSLRAESSISAGSDNLLGALARS